MFRDPALTNRGRAALFAAALLSRARRAGARRAAGPPRPRTRWRRSTSTPRPRSALTLPGIGASKAAAIVKYREEHGPYRTAEDLLQCGGSGKPCSRRSARTSPWETRRRNR